MQTLNRRRAQVDFCLSNLWCWCSQQTFARLIFPSLTADNIQSRYGSYHNEREHLVITSKAKTKETLNFLGACLDSPIMRKLWLNINFYFIWNPKVVFIYFLKTCMLEKPWQRSGKIAELFTGVWKWECHMPNRKCIHKNAVRFPLLETRYFHER